MLSESGFLTLIEQFPAARIGVLGDLMVDRFIYGSASRLSPEAPVPVVAIDKRTTQPGGAANVGHNVLSLTGQLSLFGLLGDDEAGRETRGLLKLPGADLRGVLLHPDRPSTVKTRVVAASQQVVRFDEETTASLDTASEQQLLNSLEDALPTLKVLIVSDYAKGILSPSLAQGLTRLCTDSQLKLLVDPKPVNLELFGGADVIKPNLGEALRMAGLERDPGPDGMHEVCNSVRERTGVRDVIVTAGGRGMYVLEGQQFTHLPGAPREVYDVAGAGDSSLAAIGLALACGADLISAARLGNLAGSIAVGKLGVAAVSAAELVREVKRFHGET